jgi:integration host factor subunit beta
MPFTVPSCDWIGLCALSASLGGDSVVTKKDIVKAISDQIGMTQLKTKEIVQQTFDAIIDTLVRERRIELRNFGVFEVKKRAARKARNPRTGMRVDVPEKFVVTFKPGKHMEERVRQLEEAERAKALAAQRAAAAAVSSESQPTPQAAPVVPPQVISHQTFPSTASEVVPPASGSVPPQSGPGATLD